MSSLTRCLDMLFEVVAVSLSGVIVMRIISRLNDPQRGERSQSRGRQLAVRSLKGKQQPLTDHEAEVAADVVCPSDVGCSFADVGGLQKTAHELRQAILLPLQNAHLFESSKLLRPPKGILLHGPPGTGKTLLAKAIAREAKFAFITLNPARLCSKWYGESNKFAEAYFSLAHKLAPCVLFIDEIDCLFARKGNEHEATAMLRSQFLTLWDGLLSPSTAATPVVVIAATNRPEMVDPAILRRLPLSFVVDMPTSEARADILRRLLAGEPLARAILATKEETAPEGVIATPETGGSLESGSALGERGGAPSALELLARATEGYSGSDLEQLCRSAMLRPLQEMIHSEESSREEICTVAPATAAEGVAVQKGGKGAAAAQAQGAGVQAEAEPQAEGLAEGEGSVLSMRQLTLHDFREAMMLVRPSRNRFGGAPHFGPIPVSVLGVNGGYDPELYD